MKEYCWWRQLGRKICLSGLPAASAEAAGEARQGEVEIEGQEASGAPVYAYRERPDLFKC